MGRKYYDVMIDLDEASDNDNEAYITLPTKKVAEEFKNLVIGFARKHNLDCKVEIY